MQLSRTSARLHSAGIDHVVVIAAQDNAKLVLLKFDIMATKFEATDFANAARIANDIKKLTLQHDIEIERSKHNINIVMDATSRIVDMLDKLGEHNSQVLESKIIRAFVSNYKAHIKTSPLISAITQARRIVETIHENQGSSK
jgi:DNA uptake protein ComE-like DNA-binding protein